MSERKRRPGRQGGDQPARAAPRQPRPDKRTRGAALHVDALLAHADDPNADLLAEAEAEIQAEPESAHRAAPADLTDIAALRGLLRRHGLRPNKSFGQNFLVSREVLEAVVGAAELGPDENVLEVGAGTGVLTVELAERARRVVAVELDRNILPVLRETTARFPHVELVARDLLEVDPAAVFGQAPYKLVANLPYYITALTLRYFLESPNPPQLLVVMVQWEVAERLVPARAFFPPPQVDSAIVRVDLLPAPPLAGAARDRFFRLAHAGFAEKRKQLHNSLARNLLLPQQTVAHWLAEAQIDPMRRAETLSIDDWLRLTHAAQEDLEPRDA